MIMYWRRKKHERWLNMGGVQVFYNSNDEEVFAIIMQVLIAGVRIVQSQSTVFYGHFLSCVPSALNIYDHRFIHSVRSI